MKHLQDAGRLNVIYDLVKGYGTKCPDGSDSYFPTKRIPMGLLQYMAQFFVAKPGQHVCYHVDVSTHILCGWKFLPREDFYLFCHLLLLARILSTNFLSCVNNYLHVEDIATFTALVKIYSTKYFSNTKVAGFGEIFVQRKYSPIR